MIKFPYGIADFQRIRRDGMVYVDRTALLRDVERLGDILVFLRPRRFGKSLWLSTLAAYYDLRLARSFDEVFGGLAIHREPTPLANRFFILRWNFSRVSARGDVDEIAESLRDHVVSRARVFASDYRDHLEDPIATEGSSETVLDSLLSAVRRTPYKLYLLIDEYDNFVNEVMVRDVGTYRALLHADGPFKELMKTVKESTEGMGLERVFVTGVSPVALNDLTSGFNNAEDVSHTAELASLCGFRDKEIADLLELIAHEKELAPGSLDHAALTIRTWYNGYRFTEDDDELVYNPTNTLYFLKNLLRQGKPPGELYDQNLRTDRSKLAFLARSAAGAGVIEKLTETGDEEIAVELIKSFSVDDLTKRLRKDQAAIASMLYYMGLLTRTGVPFRLRIPNLVVRKLFLDRLLEIYLPDPGDSAGAHRIAMSFFQDGDIEPLLDFFEKKLLPVLSNRDRGSAPKSPEAAGSGVNETAVKALFLSMLFADKYYRIYSEPELRKGYADLCLLLRPEARDYGLLDFLFELKLVRRSTLSKTGQELLEMTDAELRKLTPVKKAFTEARAQAKRYREALVEQEKDLNLRTFVVVTVGLERILAEEVDAREA